MTSRPKPARNAPVHAATFHAAAVALSVLLASCASKQPSSPMAHQPNRSRPLTQADPAPASGSPASPQGSRAVPKIAPGGASSADAGFRTTLHVPGPASSRRTGSPESGTTTSPARDAATPSPKPTAAHAQPPRPVPASVSADFSTGLIYPPPADAKPEQLARIFLCVFENGQWKPVTSEPAVAYSEGVRGVTYRGVPPGQMYLPAYVINGVAHASANPWIVESSGQVRELKGPCATCPSDEPPFLTLELVPSVANEPAPQPAPAPKNGVITLITNPDDRYELLYWDRTWIPVGETVLADKTVRIEGIPSKRVLWLRTENRSWTLPPVR